MSDGLTEAARSGKMADGDCLVGGLLGPRNMMNHHMAVLRGEYEAPGVEFETPPVVLDVGACCGAFALWASKRWPRAQLFCYEPNVRAFDYLAQNAKGRGWVVLQRAIARGLLMPLRQGLNNLGEASAFDLGEQATTYQQVICMPADALPQCDVLKVDTEGNETYIIEEHLAATATLPRVVCFEWHRAADRDRLHVFLQARGYILQRGVINRPDRGTFVYARPAGDGR
jgi:FkbM family methyltransferase